ncbi:MULTISPECIES: restriction endonuclease subunit S [Pseudomonas]|uniref:restriction endonuclease subunit S n=1 Tax=Pseudomonas TaxID=286 RepID=UPI002579AF8B|nr:MULTISPECIES: restriction endonuclease subunit S [Pseudomonas]
MTALLTDNLPLLAGAPNGIKKLRELILELAVRGKLVPQDPNDEPASELLKRIAEEKARLVAEGRIKKQKPLAEVNEAAMPFELPAGWDWSSLAQVAIVNPRNAAADSLEVSFVPMTFIGTRFDDQHEQEPRLWGEVKQGFTHFAEGDIGVAKITPCFENSKACVFSNLLNGLGAGTTELHIVRPVSGTLDPRYVLAYLKSPQFLLVGETKMTGTAGQKRLPKDFVEANPFPVPPLAEQHRIVAKVDELMALCDQLETRQADADSAHAQLVQSLLGSLTQACDAEDFAQSWQRLAEYFHTLFTTESSIYALKQTLLQLAVMGKLVPQDPSDEPASELLRRIAEEKATLIAEGKIRKQKQLAEITEEEKLFELAPGWEWSRLGEQVIESGAGWSPSCEPRPRERNDWGVLKVSAVSWGVYRPEENKALPVSLEARPEHEVAEGDFLVSRANTAELVARSVVVDSTPSRLMLSDKIVRLRLTKLCDAHYLNLVNSATHARQYYARVAGGTSSSMKNVSREQILSLPIAVPPLPEQHRIVAKVDQLMALCDQLKARLNQARQVHEQLACALVEQAVA